jgi:hypothetical protein
VTEARGFLFFLILLGSVATILRLVDRTRSTVPYPVLLAAGAELVALAAPAIPNPDWAARFRLLLAVVAFASSTRDDRAGRAAAIYAVLSEYQHDLARVWHLSTHAPASRRG